MSRRTLSSVDFYQFNQKVSEGVKNFDFLIRIEQRYLMYIYDNHLNERVIQIYAKDGVMDSIS